jgi:hypothetical protein
VLACAPPDLRDAAVTDTLPGDATVIAAANEPTGWRGGTGNLELLLRNDSGDVQWRPVAGAQLKTGPVCMSPESPGPDEQLSYYRLKPAKD